MSSRPVNFDERLLEDHLLGHQEGRDGRRGQLRQGGSLPALRLRKLSRLERAADRRSRAPSAGRPTTSPPTPTPTRASRSPIFPSGMTMTLGGMMYVTEIFTRHTLITPLDRFGITVPADALFDCVFLNGGNASVESLEEANAHEETQIRPFRPEGLRPRVHGGDADRRCCCSRAWPSIPAEPTS